METMARSRRSSSSGVPQAEGACLLRLAAAIGLAPLGLAVAEQALLLSDDVRLELEVPPEGLVLALDLLNDVVALVDLRDAQLPLLLQFGNARLVLRDALAALLLV